MTTTTKPQHLEALERANQVRLAHAAIVRSVSKQPTRAESAQHACEILRWPQGSERGIRVSRLLKAVRQFGHRRGARVLADAGIPPGRLDRRIGELSLRERRAIALALERRACGGPEDRPAATAGSPVVLLAPPGGETS